MELVGGVYRLSEDWSWTIDCVEMEALVRLSLGIERHAPRDENVPGDPDDVDHDVDSEDGHEARSEDGDEDGHDVDLDGDGVPTTLEASVAEASSPNDSDMVGAGGRSLTVDLQKVETLEQAWRLYAGPFMRSHSARWASRRREHYERVYERMLRALASSYERLERWDDAEDAYRSLLVNDASQEDVHVRLMKLYARRGRLDLARRQWERLCKVLLEELGVPPMDTTLREYRRLLG